jgi:hypothetical protein
MRAADDAEACEAVILLCFAEDARWAGLPPEVAELIAAMAAWMLSASATPPPAPKNQVTVEKGAGKPGPRGAA